MLVIFILFVWNVASLLKTAVLFGSRLIQCLHYVALRKVRCGLVTNLGLPACISTFVVSKFEISIQPRRSRS